MKILAKKQQSTDSPVKVVITLEELFDMQKEVKSVRIPDSINELADNILCELRRKDIPVSDRIYFNFSSVVQAEAWLGRDTVLPTDMQELVNYLWDKPEQAEVISEVIKRLTENPLGDKIDALLAKAYQVQQDFEKAADKNHALLALRSELLPVYEESCALKDALSENDAARSSVEGLVTTLEDISREAQKRQLLPMYRSKN